MFLDNKMVMPKDIQKQIETRKKMSRFTDKDVNEYLKPLLGRK